VKYVRIVYRVRQFWRTITAKTDPLELEKALTILTPGQAALFSSLQPGEQDHALVMVHKLVDRGESQPDLLVAALLHDVGKLRYKLNPLERAMVVLVRRLSPETARRWGSLPSEGWESLPGWRKPFVVAEQHEAWGAEMAHKAGVSPMAENLIRRHHQQPAEGMGGIENALQHKLWAVDNES
jgi:putative nucleotidyltransferase with HDIG domain